MALAWNICAPLGTLSSFFFNPVFQLSTAKNEINLFNNHILIVAPVTFAPAGAMTPSADFLYYLFRVHLFLLSKKKKKKKKKILFPVLTIARSNGVTIKDLNRLKTSTLVSATGFQYFSVCYGFLRY